jgi:hypothetical protein
LIIGDKNYEEKLAKVNLTLDVNNNYIAQQLITLSIANERQKPEINTLIHNTKRSNIQLEKDREKLLSLINDIKGSA